MSRDEREIFLCLHVFDFFPSVYHNCRNAPKFICISLVIFQHLKHWPSTVENLNIQISVDAHKYLMMVYDISFRYGKETILHNMCSKSSQVVSSIQNGDLTQMPKVCSCLGYCKQRPLSIPKVKRIPTGLILFNIFLSATFCMKIL